ncbi:MAG: KdsC family phosphatase [Aquabacterium sp.]
MAPSARGPALLHPPETLISAQGPQGRIRLAIFDVDGVLTDGRLLYGPDGEMLKAFHVRDGLGLKLLRDGGIVPVVITGRDSAALRQRLADLGITHAHFGVQDKLATATALLDGHALDWAEVAVIGDDWPDLPLLMKAGFACAPADAHVEVRAMAHYVTRLRGGEGAAREFCDLLLCASTRYAGLWRLATGTVDDPEAGPPP